MYARPSLVVHHAYTMRTPCVHHAYTMRTPCVHHQYNICTKCVQDPYAIRTRSVHNTYAIRTPYHHWIYAGEAGLLPYGQWPIADGKWQMTNSQVVAGTAKLPCKRAVQVPGSGSAWSST